MLGNPWFRLYHEWDSDPKVQSMPEVMQRRLVMLFCSRCRGETLQENQRAFHWRISSPELAETKALFVANGFIDEKWNLLNWNRRQFLSDSSTDRVRRFRQGKKQDETLHETVGNVTVTAPDTDTDTEQKQIQKDLALTSIEVPAGVFDLPLPGEQGEWGVPQRLYDELVKLYPNASVMGELAKMRAWLLTNPRKTAKGLPRFINNWLSKAQNTTHSNGNGRSNGHVFENKYDAARRKIREEALAEGEDDDLGGAEGRAATFQ